MSRELLFFFSALGAFNGILLGLYFLLIARPRLLWRRLFGAFVLSLSVRVGKSVFLYFNQGLAKEFLQVGLTACLFVGPLLYFCIRAALEVDSTALRRTMTAHLTGLGLIALIGGILYPYASFPSLWNPTLVYSIYGVWALYTLAAIWKIRHLYPVAFRSETTRQHRLLVFTTAGTAVVLTCYVLVSYTSYITGALVFSLLMYSAWAAVRLQNETASEKKKNETKDNAEPVKRPALLSEERATALARRLEDIMERDRPYVDANLKLADLAAAVGATTHQLSYLLNSVLSTSFHHFLNERRIQLARRLIETEPHLTLEAIGQASGFNARSTFYNAFRKTVGMTPAKYRESVAVDG